MNGSADRVRPARSWNGRQCVTEAGHRPAPCQERYKEPERARRRVTLGPSRVDRCRPLTCQVDWSRERNASVTVVRSVLVVDWSSTAPVRSTANRTSADRDPAWPTRLFPFVASPAGRYFSARAGVAEWQTLRT